MTLCTLLLCLTDDELNRASSIQVLWVRDKWQKKHAEHKLRLSTWLALILLKTVVESQGYKLEIQFGTDFYCSSIKPWI